MDLQDPTQQITSGIRKAVPENPKRRVMHFEEARGGITQLVPLVKEQDREMLAYAAGKLVRDTLEFFNGQPKGQER